MKSRYSIWKIVISSFFVEDELFAMFRQLHFKQAPQDVQLELNFTKVRKETVLDFPFSVPNKMKN